MTFAVWAMFVAIVSCKRSEPAQPRVAPPPGAPNVLLITLDTTRADHLGCYGYSKPTSKNLDWLAAQGTLFANAIAQASVTPVSHASIFTGLNPYTHGLRVMHGLSENRLRESCVTLAEVLRGVGYHTAAFVSAFPVSERFGLQQGFDHFDAEFLQGPPDKHVSPKGTITTGHAQRRAGDTTDRALAWLQTAHRPYFLWLHYFDPHDSTLRPPKEVMARHEPIRPPETQALRILYDIEIEYMDDQIGRVFEALRQDGSFEDTLIVVVADHGEGLGDHNWWTHGILYQEQIRVPLIIRAPSKPTAAGSTASSGATDSSGASIPSRTHRKRVEYLVRTIDVMPTVLDLVGLDREAHPAMEGRSLRPLLGADSPDPGYVAYSDSVNMLTYRFTPEIKDVKDDMLFSVTDGPWKYIHHLLHPEQDELYNLADDPRELSNLYSSMPDVVERLHSDLAARDFAPAGQLKDKQRMKPADIQRLKSLGYIDG